MLELEKYQIKNLISLNVSMFSDFPVAEKMAKTSMSLPVHEFIKQKDIKYVANLIANFYNK